MLCSSKLSKILFYVAIFNLLKSNNKINTNMLYSNFLKTIYMKYDFC